MAPHAFQLQRWPMRHIPYDSMLIQPSKHEFLELARQGNVVPVCADLMADFETPVSAYAKLRRTGPAFIFESIEGGARLNRYSFIGCQPRKVYNIGWKQTRISHRDGTEELRNTPKDPLAVIEGEMKQYQPVKTPGLPRFVGGMVGWLGYEYIQAVEETVKPVANDPHGMPVAHFMLIDQLVIFDRAKQTLKLLVNAHIEEASYVEMAYHQAVESLQTLYTTLREEHALAPAPLLMNGEVDVPCSNMLPAEFYQAVDKAKEYICAGDIIQVVLSQRFEDEFPHQPLNLYRALRTVNPSPYMFNYDVGDFAIVGASPEVHVRLTDGHAIIRPIAGTRPRGHTHEQDLAYEEDLLADAKERAEHLMLVDLARNDMGRVCEYGSVTVPDFMIVERYSHVMHIVSQVEGEIADGRTAYDLMRATFPAGTVSGAPKIRAMQIIAEQEKDMRGPYAGALGYFSYDGNLDSCIMLRTSLIKNGRIHIQSGAGIVADSQPSLEYQETVNKARAMFTAVHLARKIEPVT